MVKKYLAEIPPIFSSASFTVDKANLITSSCKINRKGYYQIECRTTKFNNVYRLIQILIYEYRRKS